MTAKEYMVAWVKGGHPILVWIFTLVIAFFFLWVGVSLTWVNSPMETVTKNITIKDKVLLNSILVHNEPCIVDIDGNQYSLGVDASYTDIVVGGTCRVELSRPKLTGDTLKDGTRMHNDTYIEKIYSCSY